MLRQAPTQIDLHDMFEGMNTEEMVSTCADMSEDFKDVVRSCLCFDPDVSVIVLPAMRISLN